MSQPLLTKVEYWRHQLPDSPLYTSPEDALKGYDDMMAEKARQLQRAADLMKVLDRHIEAMREWDQLAARVKV